MRKLNNSELNRKTESDYKLSKKNPIVVVLDNIRSLNNIGSVFRTSDAFLAEKIFLCGITACPPHNDIRKTALGAEEIVDWQYFETTDEAIELLKRENYVLIAVEQTENAVKLNETEIYDNKKYALIFGNEVKGVSQTVVDKCDFSIEIPQAGTKHSLNVSVSAGIVIWEFFKSFSSRLT